MYSLPPFGHHVATISETLYNAELYLIDIKFKLGQIKVEKKSLCVFSIMKVVFFLGIKFILSFNINNMESFLSGYNPKNSPENAGKSNFV
jgi:hypothetical protein